MKVRIFILKIFILTALLISAYFWSAINLTKGIVDFNYHKYTYQSNSLIIGMSRARAGIVPSILEKELKNEISRPFLNFAFERTQSEYGETYLNAIKQKIDTIKLNGLFILSVSPGSLLISNNFSNIPKDIDKHTILGKMTTFNKSPNLEYVRKCYQNSLYRGFIKPHTNHTIHNDGWVEFKGSNSQSKNRNHSLLNETKNGYELGIKRMKPSKYRLDYFEKTISYLKKYGEVVVVRLPIDPVFLNYELDYWNSFDDTILGISERHNVKYLNYSKQPDLYKTYDGSHMYSESAKRFTKTLCDSIKKYQAIN